MQWFMADPHLGINCNVKQRPEMSPDAWDDYVIEHINRHVADADTLRILGDFTHRFGRCYLDRINCKNVHLVIGNHDRPGSGRYFKSIHQYDEVEISGHTCCLFHYPIAYWRRCEAGSFHLHGHVHDWYPDYMGNQARALDVSVDTALRLFGHPGPISEAFILAYMLQRKGHASVEGRNRIR